MIAYKPMDAICCANFAKASAFARGYGIQPRGWWLLQDSIHLHGMDGTGARVWMVEPFPRNYEELTLAARRRGYTVLNQGEDFF